MFDLNVEWRSDVFCEMREKPMKPVSAGKRRILFLSFILGTLVCGRGPLPGITTVDTVQILEARVYSRSLAVTQSGRAGVGYVGHDHLGAYFYNSP